MTYKNKGPPKRSEGVLQTGIRRYDISFSSSLGGRRIINKNITQASNCKKLDFASFSVIP